MKTSQWNTHWISLCILFFFFFAFSQTLWVYTFIIYLLFIYTLIIYIFITYWAYCVLYLRKYIMCTILNLVFFTLSSCEGCTFLRPFPASDWIQWPYKSPWPEELTDGECKKKILEFHLINLGTRSNRERFEVDLVPIFLYPSEAFLS